MNILHVFLFFGIGGAQTMLVDIMNQQIKTNKVTLIVVYNSFSVELIKSLDERINVILLKVKPWSKNPFSYIKLNYYIWKLNPDILHLHEKQTPKIIIPFGYKKIVATIHSVNQRTKWWNRYDHLFAISKSVYDEINEAGYNNVSLAYNGVNFDLIKCKFRDRILNAPIRIVCVGRLLKGTKGQDYLIKAIDLIINKGYTNIHLDFIGYGESEDIFRRMVNEMRLAKYITFLGPKDRDYIYSNLYKYDLYIQPSEREGFGLTIVEGIAAGLPVLVSNENGPYEIIAKGQYGYSFINRDYYDLADKIEDFLNNSSNWYTKTRNSYNNAKNKYSVNVTTQIYLDIYKNI